MEAAVAGVGKALLNCLLSGAKAAIDQDVATRQGIQRGLPFLTDELAEMQSFLSDADVERNKDKVTRSRAKYIRDLAYEVEDCLQDYTVHSEKPSWWRIPRARLEQHRIAEEMKGLRGRVEDMAERKSRYRLVEGSSYGPERPIIVNPEIFGIEQARRVAMQQQQQGRGVMDQQDRAKMGQQDKAIIDLTQLVKKGDRDLRVVAVWGSSDDLGVGQASIIEGAYANLKKNKMFQCHARIRVMHPLNVTELLQTIIRQFYVNSLQHSLRTQEDDTLRTQILHSMGTMKEDGLADVFKNYLNEKRYLIVLDDLCTIEDWDRIKSCFPNNNTRSRIMLSTEQVEVASLSIGANSIAVDHKHLSSDRNVYAFYKKDSEDVTNLMETESSSNAANAVSNISDDRKILHQRTIQLIGREREQSDIINLITNENQHLEVISVWGMGGIGKTTLVRAVYQNQELMGQFEKRACVTAMRPFNCDELLRSVALQFGYEDAIDLRRKLGKNKYLIVFDDIASTAEWDSIVPYFPATDTASRIILTTREENIAKHCSEKHENIYQLRSLGYRDAHDLFTKTVLIVYLFDLENTVMYLYD